MELRCLQHGEVPEDLYPGYVKNCPREKANNLIKQGTKDVDRRGNVYGPSAREELFELVSNKNAGSGHNNTCYTCYTGKTFKKLTTSSVGEDVSHQNS